MQTTNATASPWKEEWRAIPGHPGYQVSNLGRVASYHRILKPATRKNGYQGVMLGRGNTAYVHHLVLEAFHGPAPKGCNASHLNGQRADNRAENLAWESHKDNCNRQIEHGTRNYGERQGNARLSKDSVLHIRSLKYERGMFSQIARQLNVAPATVEDAYKRRTWRHI